MSVIVKGVFDITYYIFSSVAHVILRDLTNYYWYQEESGELNHTVGEGIQNDLLIPNSNDERNNLESIQEYDSQELIDGECDGEHELYKSYCISTNIDDQILTDLDETEGVEDIILVQNNDSNVNSLKLLEKESFHNVPNDIDETLSIEDNSVVQTDEEKLKDLPTPQNEAFNTVPNNLDETQSSEGFTIQNIKDTLNCLNSPRKENNFIWVEIDESQQNLEENIIAQDDTDITENGHSGTTFVSSEKWSSNGKAQTLNIDFRSRLEESSILAGNTTLNDDSKFTLESSKKEYTLGNDETEEPIFIGEHTRKDFNLKSSEKMFIGDRITGETKSQNDNRSDVSSECTLGIRNFQTKDLLDDFKIIVKPEVSKTKKKDLKNKTAKKKTPKFQGGQNFETKNILDEFKTEENPKVTILKTKELKNKPAKSKISRYIGNPGLQKRKQEALPNTPDKIPTTEPINRLEEIQKAHLLPLTTYEISGRQSLLNESQDLIGSEDCVAPSRYTELHDSIWEMSSVPVETSDVESTCSDDSWLGKLASIIRSKSPEKNPDVTSIKTSNSVKGDKNEGDSCDCVNKHRCLMVVESDDELTADLLSPEELGSVETGSVSDWLYRVNPRNTLLGLIDKTKLYQTERCITEAQGQSIKPYSESSDEDFAKTFSIEQWLNRNETYYNDPNTNLYDYGDIIV